MKIAVLDTGFSPKDEFQRDIRSGRLHWEDFVTRGKKPIDEDTSVQNQGHGTCIVELLLQILPAAEIYVARVVKTVNDDFESPEVARSVAGVCFHHLHVTVNDLELTCHATE